MIVFVEHLNLPPVFFAVVNIGESVVAIFFILSGLEYVGITGVAY
jgi:hypothetical protein